MEIYRGRERAYIVSNKGAFFIPKFFVSKKHKIGMFGKIIVRFLEKLESSVKQKVLPVAFMPGFACNLSCVYCYQRIDSNDSHLKPALNKTNIDSKNIIEFICDEAKKRKLSKVDLTILGGEPFVYLKSISRFIEALSSSIPIQSLDIITNGTLMYPESLDRLSSKIPLSAQITFDGSKKSHNNYRFFKSGKGSYLRIINNIRRTQNFFDSIDIRVNIFPNSIPSIKELVDDLKTSANINMKKITFSLCPVDDTVHYSSSIKWTETAFNLYRDMAEYILESGASLSYPGHSGFCRTCSKPGQPGGLVITADGNLYSCWDSAGQSGYEVGNVITGFSNRNPKAWVRCGYGNPANGAIQNRLMIECIKAKENILKEGMYENI